VVQPCFAVLALITNQIKTLERDLVARSKRDYRSRKRLQQIAGVGPLTALCFVLKIGEPTRFGRSRDVGPYLGLCPGRDQSGGHRQATAHQQMRATACCAACW